MAAGLNGAGLVDVDVAVLGAQHALIGFQQSCDDGGIGLGAAHEKVYRRVGTAHGVPDERARPVTVGVKAVAAGLLIVGFGQSGEHLGMGALRIITEKKIQSKCLL